MNKNPGRSSEPDTGMDQHGPCHRRMRNLWHFHGIGAHSGLRARWNLSGNVQVWDAADESVDELARLSPSRLRAESRFPGTNDGCPACVQKATEELGFPTRRQAPKPSCHRNSCEKPAVRVWSRYCVGEGFEKFLEKYLLFDRY